jgi:hypothetical protein
MKISDIRTSIETDLKAFPSSNLRQASLNLLATLGYSSDKQIELDGSPASFLEQFKCGDDNFCKKAMVDDWKEIQLLFQLTDQELSKQQSLFEENDIKQGLMQSYLFFAVRLSGKQYARGKLAQITRQLNRIFPMPVMVFFEYDQKLSVAVINRRRNKRDADKDVLGKVTLIQDVSLGHLDILASFSIAELTTKKRTINSFDVLHEAWEEVFNVELLNKRFYRELSDWYFWALDQVEFPDDVEKKREVRNATSLIRLLTRLIFCWFLKEKGLIPDNIFDPDQLESILNDLSPDKSSFYQAILQNLFFATLNQKMNARGKENRKFATEGSFHENRNEYGVKNLYRYASLFDMSQAEAVALFEDIPFLNGGLFECLDHENDKGKVQYVDGFTRNKKKQPIVANELFFGEERIVDLSKVYDDKKRKKEKVRGLIHILNGYKFTIVENTPIEQEIALDPELLGKVFENLLASYNPETRTSARNQTGSFYTPRTIVDYMVDESLKAHLKSKLVAAGYKDDKNLAEGLDRLFGYTEKEHPFIEEDVVNLLLGTIDNCTILDPACGSGAFPMGVLHKLVYILGKLDPHNSHWKQRQLDKLDSVSMRDELERKFANNDDDYGRKLFLLENCIYGVDIQPTAIQISKLRCFISLICDQRANKNKAENCNISPLPNLETKFVAADTLMKLKREKQGILLVSPRVETLEEEIEVVRHRHFSANNRRSKMALQKKDKELRKELARELAQSFMSEEASHNIAEWDPYNPHKVADFFDPEWMFGRKLADGFDVVIGNPPYVQIQKFPKPQKDKWVAQKFRTYAATADIYCLFYERGVELLKEDGHLCYITSNKWMRAGYGKALRKFLNEDNALKLLIDFGELPVFEAGTDPCVLLLAHAEATKGKIHVAIVKEIEAIYDISSTMEQHGFLLNKANLNSEGWTLDSPQAMALLEKIRAAGQPLGEYVNGRFYYGIKTGFNEAFVIDRKTRDDLIASDPNSAKIIKPWLRGKDIKRWYADFNDLYVINIFSSANAKWPWSGLSDDEAEAVFKKNYPAIFSHLHPYKNRLIARDDQGQYYWELRSCAYNAEFDQPKIVYADIAKLMRASYDTDSMFCANTMYLLPTDNLFLLGFLNGQLFDWYARNTFQCLGDPWKGGRLRFIAQYMANVPIPSASSAHQSKITDLVSKVLSLKRENPNADVLEFEYKIDQLVYQLFDLTPDEIAIVERERK